MTEDRDTKIGAALRALPVPEHEPEFWAEVESALASAGAPKRFRGTALRVAASLVAVGLVATGIAARHDRATQRVVAEPDAPYQALNGAPATFVGIDAGRPAVFSTETGQQMHFVGMEPYEPGSNVALTEPRTVDGSLWFVDNVLASCEGGFVKVDRSVEQATSEGALPGAASDLAVSPDGSMVAYVRGGECPGGDPSSYQVPVLVIRNMATGEEHTISMGNPPSVYGPPSWAPDNRHLALMARGGGGVAYGISVIDTATATNIGDGQDLHGPYCYQERPTFLADGTVVALTCPERNSQTVTAMRFDAQGNQLGPLFDLIGNFDSGNSVDQVTSFSLTSDGKHSIYQIENSHSEVSTYRWDGGDVHRVETGARDIAW